MLFPIDGENPLKIIRCVITTRDLKDSESVAAKTRELLLEVKRAIGRDFAIAGAAAAGSRLHLAKPPYHEQFQVGECDSSQRLRCRRVLVQVLCRNVHLDEVLS